MPQPSRRIFPTWHAGRIGMAVVLACSLFALALGAAGGEPLHERIDRHIEAPLQGVMAPLCSDEEFVRRVYLDLAGRIPSRNEAAAFLADPASTKREALIDRLLASPSFARRMAYVFDILLMERRTSAVVPPAEWQEYLRQAFLANKPYNELVREILAEDGATHRPAARFYLDRGGETNLLTKDIGRLFFGMDLQCAQCHDHPLIDDYKQQHYYGIYAFLNRSFLFTDAQNVQYFPEKAEGDVAFKSVFDAKVDEKNFLPRLPGGEPLVEPQLDKGTEYLVRPDKTVRPIPKYSRKQQLAALTAQGENPAFTRNIVNRLWCLMLGRGIVHPPGLEHSDNPPSHPELLNELAAEFVALKFDIRALLRELALTRTYQRSSVVPPGMSQEQAAPQRFAVAALRPLSPEQLTWSLLEAAGLSDSVRSGETARMAGDRRLTELFDLDEKRQRLREELVEQAVYNALGGNVAQFVALFGGSPGEPEQDFNATVHQALFFANGGTVRSWFAPSGNNTVGRAAAIEDPRAAADELYLALLTRRPTEDERLEVVEYLLRCAEQRAAGVHQIAWALVASNEFRFNH